MNILELFDKVNNESDNYFVVSKNELDIDYLNDIKNHIKYEDIMIIYYDEYIVIFNINKERELNNAILLSIDKINELKKG